MTDYAKRLLCFLMLLLFALPCAAETLHARYKSGLDGGEHIMECPFEPEWFTESAEQYNHLLARTSLGLATAAYRLTTRPGEEDTGILDFLNEAGFADIVTEEYNIPPTIDTIGTALAYRPLPDGSTLLVVGISGQGYRDEWMSNFTIGGGRIHRGFAGASERVRMRIDEYLESRGLSGRIRIWLAGFSRAAAVSNLTGAALSDDPRFAPEDVFCYTFATPRTTKAPGDYHNIFNIVGKFDPVTAIPLAEWGFVRHGQDLFTPALETDSDYAQRFRRGNIPFFSQTGTFFRDDTEMNHILRQVLYFLYELLPTNAAYERHLQKSAVNIWAGKSDITGESFTTGLQDLCDHLEYLNETQRDELIAFFGYLSTIVQTKIIGRTRGDEVRWHSASNIIDNILHEHMTEVYYAWLCSSDDPAEVFTATDSYLRMGISGDVGVAVYDDAHRFLFWIDDRGTISYVSDDPKDDQSLPLEERPTPIAVRLGKETVVTLPRDRAYYVTCGSYKEQDVEFFAAEYVAGHVAPESLFRITLRGEKFGETTLYCPKDGEESFLLDNRDPELIVLPCAEDSMQGVLAGDIAEMESGSVFHLTFRQFVLLALLVLILLIVIVIILVRLLLRFIRWLISLPGRIH